MISFDEIRSGLDNSEFFLEYLPIISLEDGRCSGAEALIRWQHGTRLIQPDDFIPLAENTVLSGLITYWVMETIANELKDWLGRNPEAYISINVPPEILGRGGMAYVAGKTGLLDYASQLVVEITERGIPDVMGMSSINNASKMGVRVALDDITLVGGTNLAILSRCNFDITKLDRSLVWQLQPGAPTPEWLTSISALLQTSSMTVIAEGVETEHQYLALKEAKIQAAQGFLFSRPIPATDFICYYQDNK